MADSTSFELLWRCLAMICFITSVGDAAESERAEGRVIEQIPQGSITLFLCGDVMTGRGIYQVLPHPGESRLQENYVKNASVYVELAERAFGPISKPVAFSYIWGDALEELNRVRPDLRIINLETSVSVSDAYWRGVADAGFAVEKATFGAAA